MTLSTATLDSALRDIETSIKLIREYVATAKKTETDSEGKSSPDPLSSAPTHVKLGRIQLLESMKDLQQSISGPYELWEQFSINNQYLSCFRWMLYFKIPTILPLNELKSYNEVALVAKVPVLHLRHVIRMLMTVGMFVEPSPNIIAHNALSASFRDSSSYAQACAFMANMAAPTSYRMAEMTERYGESEIVTETALNVAMQTDQSFFAYLNQNPSLAAGLMAGMKLQSEKERSHTDHLIHGFDWEALGTTKVVDVGGSMGHISISLAQAFPELHFEVQDLQVVVDKAKRIPLPSAISERVKFRVHDFFLPQPLSSRDASVFLVRAVLQNHPVRTAQNILRNIASVMKPGALIIINNALLPEPGTLGSRAEAAERARSLFMMQAMNGADRDEEEFRHLIAGVGCELRLREIIRPEGGTMAIIVVEKLEQKM